MYSVLSLRTLKYLGRMMLTRSFMVFARKAKPAARQRVSSCRAAGLASLANSRTGRHCGAKDTLMRDYGVQPDQLLN